MKQIIFIACCVVAYFTLFQPEPDRAIDPATPKVQFDPQKDPEKSGSDLFWYGAVLIAAMWVTVKYFAGGRSEIIHQGKSQTAARNAMIKDISANAGKVKEANKFSGGDTGVGEQWTVKIKGDDVEYNTFKIDDE